MESRESVPTLSWRLLGLSVAFIFLVIVLVIGLISAGTFDPNPIGELSSTYLLESVSIARDSQNLIWLQSPVPNDNFTVKLIANWSDGELDIDYGLAIGDQTSYFVIAVSPVGYLTIWEGQILDDKPAVVETIIPFQTWPHVRTNEEANEIWLDVNEGKITSVRINRELLWEGSLSLSDTRLGIWTQSFGQPAEIVFQQLEVFGDQFD